MESAIVTLGFGSGGNGYVPTLGFGGGSLPPPPTTIAGTWTPEAQDTSWSPEP